MGKRFVIERETNVREEPDMSALEIIGGLVIWFFVIALFVKGCGG